MNSKKIAEALTKSYPGATILYEPTQKPKAVHAIIKAANGLSSVMQSVVDEIPAHHHKKTAEIYYVVKGSLTLFVNGETFAMHEGDYHIVQPGETHWAQGNETQLEIYAEPAWTQEDTIYGEPQAAVAFPHQSRLITDSVASTVDSLTVLFRCTVMEQDKRRAVLRCGDAQITVVLRESLPEALKELHGYVMIDHSNLDKVIEEAEKKQLTMLFRQGALAFLCDSSHNIFELHERQTI